MATNVANQSTTFLITDRKLYDPVLTLSTQDNAKLLQQSKSSFKRTINWNKYQSKKLIERPNQYFDYLIEPSFQGVIDFLFYHLKMKPNEQVTNNINFRL